MKPKNSKKNVKHNVKNNNIIHANEIIFYTKTNPRYSVHASVFSIEETKKIIKLANDNGFQDATVGESNSGDGSEAWLSGYSAGLPTAWLDWHRKKFA